MFVVQNVISALLRGTLLWDISNRVFTPKYPRWVAWLVFSAVSVLGNLPLSMASQGVIPFGTLVYYGCFLLCMIFLYSDRLARKLIYGVSFFALLSVGQVAIVLVLSVLPEDLQTIINRFPGMTAFSSSEFLIFLVYILMSFGFCYLVLRAAVSLTKSVRGRSHLPKQWWFVLAPISQVVMIFMFVAPTMPGNNIARQMGPSFWVGLLIALLVCVVSDVSLFRIMGEMDKKALLEVRLQQMEQAQLSDYRQYQLMDKLYRQERMFHHDINNKLAASISMLEHGDKKECAILLREISDQIGSYKRQAYCENALIDTVLSNKLGYAEEFGIRVKVDVRVGQLNISPSDLCSVFSNILDNAIEACHRISPEKEAAMSLRASLYHGYLVIKCENSAPLPDDVPVPECPPKKEMPNAHGWGLEILRQIAEKYHGELRTSKSNEVFFLEEILRNEVFSDLR